METAEIVIDEAVENMAAITQAQSDTLCAHHLASHTKPFATLDLLSAQADTIRAQPMVESFYVKNFDVGGVCILAEHQCITVMDFGNAVDANAVDVGFSVASVVESCSVDVSLSSRPPTSLPPSVHTSCE